MSDQVPVKTGMFRSATGDLSSKRIAGTVILMAGALFLLALGARSFGRVIADPGTALTVGKTLILSGAGLLGVGVVERLAPGGKGK